MFQNHDKSEVNLAAFDQRCRFKIYKIVKNN